MLTFIRWANRDPNNYTNPDGGLATTQPLVVVNDCISVTVNGSKASHTPAMHAVLRAGDINYMTAVAPGDFVFVNMVNWSQNLGELAERAKKLQPINELKDGFKGFFKIQSVRRTLGISPSGAKEVVFTIDRFGFTEFNNSIYFNPHLIPPGSEKAALFVSQSR